VYGTAWLVVAILYGGGLRLLEYALVDTSDFGQVLDEA
jgi:hypothetical protein